MTFDVIWFLSTLSIAVLHGMMDWREESLEQASARAAGMLQSACHPIVATGREIPFLTGSKTLNHNPRRASIDSIWYFWNSQDSTELTAWQAIHWFAVLRHLRPGRVDNSVKDNKATLNVKWGALLWCCWFKCEKNPKHFYRFLLIHFKPLSSIFSANYNGCEYEWECARHLKWQLSKCPN